MIRMTRRQMERLPKAFQEIIHHDRNKPTGSVINLSARRDWQKRRTELSLQARHYGSRDGRA